MILFNFPYCNFLRIVNKLNYMVEARDVSGYLPAQGNRLAHNLEIEIGGALYVGDESSLSLKNPAPPAKKPMIIDPEPPPFIVVFRPV